MPQHNLRELIESAYERRQEISAGNADASLVRAIEETIGLLDRGEARVAERRDGQ